MFCEQRSIKTITLGVGILVATIDLVERSMQHVARSGIATIVAGAVVVLISFFGLLVGVVEVLLIAVGVGSRHRDVT